MDEGCSKAYYRLFDSKIMLHSIFNVVNEPIGESSEKPYVCKNSETLVTQNIIYPVHFQKHKDPEGFYGKILSNTEQDLLGIEMKEDYINSILAVLENNWSGIPSSTFTKEIPDISLFEHSKLVAAFACCIYEYLQEQEKGNYKVLLLDKSKEFYGEKAFLYYIFDLSGIQDFIYTIHSEGALRNLRARSFYLEIMVENIVDEILGKLGLSRANLLWTGGGHAHLLLPNTKLVKEELENINKQINDWLQINFQIKLFFADAYFECTSIDFMDKCSESFVKILDYINKRLQQKKYQRYSMEKLNKLNNYNVDTDGTRECKVCHKTGEIDADNLCSLCHAFYDISKYILNPENQEANKEIHNKEMFVITTNKRTREEKDRFKISEALPLPMGKFMYFVNSGDLETYFEDQSYVRLYSKNQIFMSKRMETHLWVGDYNRWNTLGQTVEQAEGVRRLGALRLDVDNLSDAFISGFHKKNTTEGEDYQHNTLSRKTVFSNRMSLFFKYYINKILQNELDIQELVENSQVD